MLETNTKIYPNKKGSATIYVPPGILNDSNYPLTSTAVKISIYKEKKELVISNE